MVVSADVNASLAERAADLARLLRSLANARRLIVLCHLVRHGECTVGMLASVLATPGAPSQSSLSQHLARLRAEGLVATRREAQTIWYRIADPRVESLLERLRELYCTP